MPPRSARLQRERVGGRQAKLANEQGEACARPEAMPPRPGLTHDPQPGVCTHTCYGAHIRRHGEVANQLALCEQARCILTATRGHRQLHFDTVGMHRLPRALLCSAGRGEGAGGRTTGNLANLRAPTAERGPTRGPWPCRPPFPGRSPAAAHAHSMRSGVAPSAHRRPLTLPPVRC